MRLYYVMWKVLGSISENDPNSFFSLLLTIFSLTFFYFFFFDFSFPINVPNFSTSILI